MWVEAGLGESTALRDWSEVSATLTPRIVIPP